MSIADSALILPNACTVGNFKVIVTNTTAAYPLTIYVVDNTPGQTSGGVTVSCTLTTNSNGSAASCSSPATASVGADTGLAVFYVNNNNTAMNLVGSQLYARFTCN